MQDKENKQAPGGELDLLEQTQLMEVVVVEDEVEKGANSKKLKKSKKEKKGKKGKEEKKGNRGKKGKKK